MELCDIEPTRVDGPLLPADSVVIADGSLFSEVKAFSLQEYDRPELLNYQDASGAWYLRPAPKDDRRLRVWVRDSARPDPAVLRISGTPQGPAMQLLRTAEGPVLYEQRLRYLPTKRGGPRICPASSVYPETEELFGYHQALKRALGVNPIAESSSQDGRSQIRPFRADTVCEAGRGQVIDSYRMRFRERDTKHREVQVDGRVVRLDRGFPMDLESDASRAFCQSDHVVVVTREMASSAPPAQASFGVNAAVFERSSMRVLGIYKGWSTCEFHQECKELVEATLSAVTVRDDGVEVTVADRGFLAKRLN